MEKNRTNGMVVSALSSGTGKTTVSCLLLAALAERGVAVQPFKVGPDFIDPQYHSCAAGAPSRNLDSVLMGAVGVQSEVGRHLEGRIGLVEGVMGLFDGADADTDFGSTYEISRLLGWPVILVIEAEKAGRSLAVVVDTLFRELGEQLVGVVLNRVRRQSHVDYLRAAFNACQVPLLGILPEAPEIAWQEQHLGLELTATRPLWQTTTFSRTAETYLDIGAIIERVEPDPVTERQPQWESGRTCTLGIASDEGFRFYYESCLDFLKEQGVELKPFSPIRDSELPEGIDGLIIGGGFPESYANRLSTNRALRKEIYEAIQSGMPCYAECGGMMFLAEKVLLRSGECYEMCGVVPGTTELTERLQHFGYCECYESEGHSTSPAPYLGHEFHYSRWLNEAEHANRWFVQHRRSRKGRWEGYTIQNLHASYVHLYFAAYPSLFESLFTLSGRRTREGRSVC